MASDAPRDEYRPSQPALVAPKRRNLARDLEKAIARLPESVYEVVQHEAAGIPR